jgi:hypothetical protein|tara:strand:- start:768 stop:905 length:138 start_codon:yes stop_codon:yes gene_type:complete
MNQWRVSNPTTMPSKKRVYQEEQARSSLKQPKTDSLLYQPEWFGV